MPLYECVLIARNDVTQQQVESIADAIAAQIDADNGFEPAPPPAPVAEGETAPAILSPSVKKREYWGLRSLAYRIKKNRKGHYMLLGLDAKPASISEMERQLGLNEDVLRFMTIRVDAIDEAPSAILSRKSDDRERSFRGPKPAGRFESGRKRGFDDREEFRARDDVARDEFRGEFRGVEE
ncbi:MAG: 30S ribosomal protein S6 [Rhodospirillales bacterium]|nr:30S ribosomal protein S6 [Rhodospirillales bacterium]MDE2576957.1 30S ribosomal protein S6 [Rhodospirillales bacterium]